MIRSALHILRNMGLRYVLFRAWYELRRRTGMLRWGYPTTAPKREWLSLSQWRTRKRIALLKRPASSHVQLSREARGELREEARRIAGGELRFFHGEWRALGPAYDWLTHPLTGYRFAPDCHWTRVEDFGAGQGDIKYVWEPARFAFVQTLLRADTHLDTDHAALVFARIRSWLDHAPCNCGPHYKCSQEQVLRVLNWLAALDFYRDSPALDEALFGRMMGSIYRQIQHVERNLAFSRIAVRNNHAISEGLGLYVVGTLCPWFGEARRWRTLGRRVLEEEGRYQIAPDGSYIQHSFTYQRMVVQLYSVALAVARRAGENLSDTLCARLHAMVDFLGAMQDRHTGHLPNYGPNDGSMVLQVSSCGYRDFRPQLHTLAILLGRTSPYGDGPWVEEAVWLGFSHADSAKASVQPSPPAVRAFDHDGYYVLRAGERFAMIRCGNHRGRPAHADNLHCDIWVAGVNLLRDAGTYRYNDDPALLDFFMGGGGHNTVLLDGQSQMRRGPRFIWYDWSRRRSARVAQGEQLRFEGAVEAFGHLGPGIVHRREVCMGLHAPWWEITDTLSGFRGRLTQCWNLHERFSELGFQITCRDEHGEVSPEPFPAWYSSTYGVKVAAQQVRFSTTGGSLWTRIDRGSGGRGVSG